MKKVIIRMIGPPMMFEQFITDDQWVCLTEEEQDKIVTASETLLSIKLKGGSSVGRLLILQNIRIPWQP